MDPRFVKFIFLSVLLTIGLTSLIFQFVNRIESKTQNNGGPRENNFGMINNLTRANNSKIVDNDNNNNINLSIFQNNKTVNVTIYVTNYNFT